MKYHILLALLLFSAVALAQRPGGGQRGPSTTGAISGVLIDSVTQGPIEFATIVLYKANSNEQVKGATTDADGEFKIQGVPPGKYDVQLAFLGFEGKKVEDIETTLKSPDFDLETVGLVSESFDLGAVEVTGKKATFESKIDKLVYNADQDITTAGGDASDVMQRVPLLAVDGEGNLTLRGSGNIQILVNGRQSTIFQSNPGEALKSIPAEQIKSVEVITVPTAKYDGEGSAGIINIITKKKTIEGFTGNVGGTLGTRSNSANLSLNYASGRFGLNFNGGGWASWPRESSTSFFREDFVAGAEPRTLEQESNGETNFYGPRATLGAFYDFNAFNSLSTSITYRGFGRNQDAQTDATLNDPNADIFEDFTRDSETQSLRGGFDWTTDYVRKFSKPDQELAFAFQISGDQSTTENNILQMGNDPSLFLDEFNENDGLNLETTFQVDYTHPFSKAVKLEVGAKSVLRDIESDFEYRSREVADADYTIDPARSDVFNYDQDVYAGYASFNIKLGENYGLVAGARYEFTELAGDFDSGDFEAFDNTYDNVLPSIIVSRKFGQFTSVKASYTKRIQRPSLFFINPYVDLSDPRDIQRGNPELLPENSDQYEINMNTYIKGVVLNASVYYRQTNDVIQRILDVTEDGVSITSFRNTGTNKSIGANFFSSVTIKDIWSIRGGANVFTYNAEGIVDGETVTNDAIVWNGNINTSLQLPKDFVFEVNGFYRSPRQTLQGQRASYRRISFGLQKELWDKKARIGLVASQPFSRDLTFENELEGATFRQVSTNRFESRSIGITFNYRFGKLDFNNRRRSRSRINNDDLKGGDGGNNY